MKRTKKIVALSLALAMGIMAFSGCTSPSTTGSSSAAGGASTTDSKPKSDKLVELTWYSMVDSKMPDEQKVFDELNKYVGEKINVKVNQNLMTFADYIEKMPVKIASGEKFDMAFMATWALNYPNSVQQGVCLDLDTLLESDGKETKEFIPEMLWNASKVNGKIHGIPIYKETGAQYVFMYNKDIADKYNIDATGVKRMTDIEPILKQVKENDPNIIGTVGVTFQVGYVWEPIGGSISMPGAYKVDGYPDFQEQTGVFNQYETQEFMDYCKMTNRWFKAGYLSSDPVQYSKDAPGYNRDDSAGKLFSTLPGYAPGSEYTREQLTGHKVAYQPLMDPVFTQTDSYQIISSKSEHAAEAMAFLNLVNTDVFVATTLRHGIEGVHYTAVGEDRVDASMGGKIDLTNPGYNYPFGWQFGSPLNHKWDISYPDTISQSFQDFNKTAKASKHLGFTLVTDKVTTQIAAIQSVIDQYINPLSSGMVDPETQIPVFLKALKDAGVDAYLEEVTKQVTEWEAANLK